MPDQPTVDSPDAAARLGQLLYDFTALHRQQGAQLHRAGRVKLPVRKDDRTVQCVVEEDGRQTVTLQRTGDGWSGTCTCRTRQNCQHVFAVALAWLAQLSRGGEAGRPEVDETTAAALAASLNPPRRLTFRQQWEPVLAEKLGRLLSAHEGAFLGKLANLYQTFRTAGRLPGTEIERLGFSTNETRRRGYQPVYQGWWEQPPRDPLELWQFVAYDLETSGLSVPEFIRPITDTMAIRHRLENRARRETIDRWRQRLSGLAATAGAASLARPPSEITPEPLDLRLCIGTEDWTLETRPTPAAPWKNTPKGFLDRFTRESAASFAHVEASPAVIAFLALCQEQHRRTYALSLKPGEPGARQLLRKLLAHPLARTLIITPGGHPLAFSAEPVRWRVLPGHGDAPNYEIALYRPDGTPLPPSAVHLPGEPDYYLHGGTIYPGPPPLDGSTAAAAVVPVEAVESPDVLRMLRQLGTQFPPEIEQRFRTLPLRARIRCALELDSADNETLALQLEAVSDSPPALRRWTPRGWVAPAGAPQDPASDDDRILVFDFEAPNRAAGHLDPLKLSYGEHRHHWTRRFTRAFPEEFLAWRESLPPDVELLATGELASLLARPVHARVDLELVNAQAHRDWFDLALVLKPEDTTLTAEELALLLKARGRLVRLPGKGWRRLKVDIDDASADALEAAGFDREAVAEEALAGARHRFHALQLAQTGVSERLPQRQAEILRARVREIAQPEPPEVPAKLRAKLRPYQKDGFRFLAFLAANGLGGVLADDMGLGKTVQTLAWLLWLAGRQPDGEPLRALVVCPKSVVGTWEAETRKFAPSLRFERFAPGTTDPAPAPRGKKAAAPRRDASGLLVVANYAQLRINAGYFGSQDWGAIVLDEGQFIKNPASKVAQIARELPGQHRVVLTGTPIENRLLDLWSLFAFALPGLLGTQAMFKRHYGDDNPHALPRLRARVRHFLLRRTKGQVAADLPPRTEEDILVDLEGEQAMLYQAELKRARAELLQVKTDREFDRSRFNILASLLRLRQICCHPALVDRAHAGAPSAKLDDLLERVEELRDEGHQVLVFSQFVSMLELIRERLVAADIGHLMLTGQTENRDELVARFQSDKGCTAFLLSLKAAGFGLNLTAASYVILFDPWWNPAVEAQAIDRTHRIGQSAPVNAYRLIARGTVEEKIRLLQREKAALAGAIVQEESVASVLDLESLRQILG
jgi:hypothetical protein